MKTKSMIKNTRQVVMKLLPALFCVVLVALTWTGTFFNAMPTAHALTVKTTPFILADSNPVDQVFGSGTSDQIQGKAKEDIGTVERNVGKAKEDVKGAAKQAQGRAQQDTGRLKNRAEDAGSDMEEASQNLGDAIKSLFWE
ncbi:MAG: CsbD family protein [Coleofasciculus sp. G3-WIS-01]|uniref:CsbD family protein n=1 Tax=Coleofasciculus sp. G3-WIS-01 TaxID=3069528 RepID=UPI0032FA6148